MDVDTVLLEADEKMSGAVLHTQQEFNTLNTGKANPNMVENLSVTVEAYGGSSMQIKEMAAVTTPDARTIQIQPWDKSVVKEIEKAIQTAKLGLNPLNDGSVIRIPIPELSGERRRELIKVAHNMAEEGRISIRHARKDALDQFKKMQKDSTITEDDLKRLEKDIQTETDNSIQKIGRELETKEKELKTI